MVEQIPEAHLSFIKTFVHNSHAIMEDLDVQTVADAGSLECQKVLAQIYPMLENAAFELNLHNLAKVELPISGESIPDQSRAFFLLQKNLVEALSTNEKYQAAELLFDIEDKDFFDNVCDASVIASDFSKPQKLKAFEYLKATLLLNKERVGAGQTQYQQGLSERVYNSEIYVPFAKALCSATEFIDNSDVYEDRACEALINVIHKLASHNKPLNLPLLKQELPLHLKNFNFDDFKKIPESRSSLNELFDMIQQTRHSNKFFHNLELYCDISLEGLGTSDKKEKMRQMLQQEAEIADRKDLSPFFGQEEADVKLPPKWQQYEQPLDLTTYPEAEKGITFLAANLVQYNLSRLNNHIQMLNKLDMHDENLPPEIVDAMNQEVLNGTKDLIVAAVMARKYLGIELNPSGLSFKNLKNMQSSPSHLDENSQKIIGHFMEDFSTLSQENASAIEAKATTIDNYLYIAHLPQLPDSKDKYHLYHYSAIVYQKLAEDSSQRQFMFAKQGQKAIAEQHPEAFDTLLDFLKASDIKSVQDPLQTAQEIDNGTIKNFIFPLYLEDKIEIEAFDNLLGNISKYESFNAEHKDAIKALSRYHLEKTYKLHQDKISHGYSKSVMKPLQHYQTYSRYNECFNKCLLIIGPEGQKQQKLYKEYKATYQEAKLQQQSEQSITQLIQKSRGNSK